MFISRPISCEISFGCPANMEEGDGGGGGGLMSRQSKIQFLIMKKSEPRKQKSVWTKFIVLQAVIIKHSLTKSSHLSDFKIMASQGTAVTIIIARQGRTLRGGGTLPKNI